MNARQTKILDIMSSKKRITVTELAEALGVSEVTTRKDLSQLESRGLLGICEIFPNGRCDTVSL